MVCELQNKCWYALVATESIRKKLLSPHYQFNDFCLTIKIDKNQELKNNLKASMDGVVAPVDKLHKVFEIVGIHQSRDYFDMPVWNVLHGTLAPFMIPNEIWRISDKEHRKANFTDRANLDLSSYKSRTEKQFEKYLVRLSKEATFRTLNIFCLKLVEFEERYIYPKPDINKIHYLSIYIPKLQKLLLECLSSFCIKLGRKDLFFELGDQLWNRFFIFWLESLTNFEESQLDVANDYEISSLGRYLTDKLGLNIENPEIMSFNLRDLFTSCWAHNTLQKKYRKVLNL